MAGLQYYFFPTDFYYPRPPAASAPSASVEGTAIKAVPAPHQPNSKGSVAMVIDGLEGEQVLHYGKAGSVSVHNNIKQKQKHVGLFKSKQDHKGKRIKNFANTNKVAAEV